MFLLTKPQGIEVFRFLEAQKTEKFSYPEIGCTRGIVPAGYLVDHNRIELGHGRETFERAKLAIRNWKMFDMPWVSLWGPETPIEPQTNVAVLVHHFGFWSLNGCRIVYVIDERARMERYGFAYGTLRQHAEIGEERFTIEYNSADDSVAYDLYAVSRPGPLARLAYPLARRLQKHFAQDSKQAVRNFVRGI
jgi:uncharacterized protein (UPF0548 family)